MASEISLPINGYAVPSSTSPAPAQTQSQSNELAKEEIGWYFVERYYNTLSKSPESLYLLYNKRSQFVAGVEEEKVHVSIGLKAINDRVKELNYHNCKVRITNVDSQSSDINIVVQVIGEMTNDSQPHRKFVQTFVLAPQPQGYFLLNDILRFIAEEDEEPLETQPEAPREAQKDVVVPIPAPAKPPVEVSTEETAKKVDEQLEEIAKEKEEEPVNGTSAEAEAAVEEPPEVEVAPPVAEEKPAEVEKPVEKVEPEKPAEPIPTPVETKSPAKPSSASSKPAVPLSWAQRLSANTAKAPAAAPAPAPAASVTPTAQSKTTPAPASTPAAPPNTAVPTAGAGTPARQPSPVDSNGDGSQGGWQTAGADHNRPKSRPQAQAGPALTENGHVRAYVKNVYQSVKAEDLKAELSKYGELAYFDVSRQKNSAFVEFATVEGFRAAVAANPHKIGNDSIVVEERRPTAFNARGGARGGARGTSFDARNQQRTGFAKEGSPRGGSFPGNRGGRGQAPGVAGKGRAQAV